MPDKLIELAKAEYGILAIVVAAMGWLLKLLVSRVLKSYENLRTSVFGSESDEEVLGLNSRVDSLEKQRNESKDELRVELEDAKNEREKLRSDVDEKLANMADSIKTLTDNLTNTNNDMVEIKEHLSYIRGCFDGKAQEENSQIRNRRATDPG